MERLLYSKRIADMCEICMIEGEIVKNRECKVNTIVVQKGDIVKVVTTSRNAYDWYKDLIATLPKHKIELSMI